MLFYCQLVSFYVNLRFFKKKYMPKKQIITNFNLKLLLDTLFLLI